jgi:hypothetical protein
VLVAVWLTGRLVGPERVAELGRHATTTCTGTVGTALLLRTEPTGHPPIETVN